MRSNESIILAAASFHPAVRSIALLAVAVSKVSAKSNEEKVVEALNYIFRECARRNIHITGQQAHLLVESALAFSLKHGFIK